METFNLEDIAKAVHSDSIERNSVITDVVWQTVCDGDAVKVGNDLLCASNVIQLIMDGDDEELKSKVEFAIGRVLLMNDDMFEELRYIAGNEVNKHIKGGE